MRGLIRNVLCASLVAALATSTAAIAGPVVVSGQDSRAVTDGNVRYRNLSSTAGNGTEEVYLGAGDLGVAANRVALQADGDFWTASQTFTFGYDGTNLYTQVGDGDRAEFAFETPLPSWNYLEIETRGNANNVVSFKDFTLDGVNLGDFSDDAERYRHVTGIDLRSGFEITGTIELSGAFSGTNEGNRLSIALGHVIPLPSASAMAGVGLVLVGARRRRVA